MVIAILAISSYAVRFTVKSGSLPTDTFFRYSTAIGAVAVDGILLAIVLLIARGLPLRETFALRAPRSWAAAALIGAATLIVAYALSYAEVGLLQDAHREQSVPEFFDATRLGAWVANLFAIAIFVPIFEESLCRGLGFSLLEPLGKPAAVVLTAVGFTLAHGVVVDFPVILATGLGLGYLRASSGSLYPCLALHGVFNGFGLVVASLFGG